MLRQAELFNRARDCELALNAATDPEKRIAFKILRDMWIALANEGAGLSEVDMARQIAAIEELQSTLAGS